MIVGDLAGRDLSRFARSARSSGQLSAASLLRREQPERDAQLTQLVEHGAAPTIRALLRSPDAARFDWGQRDAAGATLLMRALRDGSSAVVESLLAGPPVVFAGMDTAGWNVLHHAVSRGQARFLCDMLERHPTLAAYVDFSANQTATPLRMAYAQRDQTLFALLLVTPLPRVEALIATTAHAPPIRCGAALSLAGPPPSLPETVYPFDSAGRMLAPGAPATLPHQHATRQPVASRLALLQTAITDNEPDFVRALLKRLEPATLAAARDAILHAAIERGQFATARAVIAHFGKDAFTPLSSGATLCHLAARRLNDDTLCWLLFQPACRAMLTLSDNDGRTPLQCAAAAGSLRCFMALHCHYPDLSLRDAHRRGVLQLLFRADPAAAHKVLDDPALRARLTPADLTETLQATFRKLLDFDFEQSWQPNDENTLEMHANLIRTLLSLPAGRIDVHAPVGESGHSIFTLLDSGTLADMLDRGRDEECEEIKETIREHYAHYENATLVARARAHLQPPEPSPAPQSGLPPAPPSGSSPPPEPAPGPVPYPF